MTSSKTHRAIAPARTVRSIPIRAIAIFIAVFALLPACGKRKAKVPLFDSAAFYGAQKAGPVEFAGGPGKVAPPMSLTCSDGTGLRLESLNVRAVIEGPLAFTELHLEFHNPEPRQREGRFSITLPPGAVINRFAMYTNKWMEGEVVEKQQARRIYEDYLHKKQDPALLEVDAGNTFRARVFPIPANGNKRLIISYTSELARADDPYVLPLKGLGQLGSLAVTIAVHHQSKGDEMREPRVVQVFQDMFEPKSDLVVYPAAVDGPSALRNGDLVATRITLPTSRKKQRFGEVLVLFDTSASEAVDFKGRVDRLGDLVAFVGKNGAKKVKVVAFDQVAEEIFDGAPAKWGKDERAKLLARGALGASDWGATLNNVGALMAGRKGIRVIAFGNGVATAGLREIDQLKKAALALRSAGVIRIDTVEMAAQRDMNVLRAIATAGLENDGVHVQLAADGSKPDFSDLLAATFRPIRVAIKGASWVWPRELKGLRGGSSAIVYAQQDGDTIEIELSGGVEKKLTVKPTRASRSLLETAWVGARIKRLLNDGEFGDPDMRPMAKKQALKLSIKHRVLCELTALLVLESDREYERYGIKQTALADILSVTEDLEVAALDRGHAYASVARKMVKREDTAQLGWFDRLKARFSSSDSDDFVAEKAERRPIQFTKDAAMKEKSEKKAAQAEPDDEAGAVAGESELEQDRGGMPGAAPPPESELKLEATADKPKDAEERQRNARKVISKRTIAGGLMHSDVEPKLFAAGSDADGAMVVRGFGGLAKAGKAKKRAMRAESGSLAGALGDSRSRAYERRRLDYLRPSHAELAARRERSRLARERRRLARQRRRLAKQSAELRAEQRRLAEERRAREAVDRGRKELEELRSGIANSPNIKGNYAKVRHAIDSKKFKTALRKAWAWRDEDVANVMALVALGDAYLALEEPGQAARAYGSLIDLFPSRADLRRFAGNLLDTTDEHGHRLAIDTYLVAVEQRPDHPAGYHMLAMALAQDGEFGDAIAALEGGLKARRRAGNFRGVDRILRDDLEMLRQAQNGSGTIPPNIRFILTWETDANDVDFHIFDSKFEHASFRQRALRSGGSLYADITTGYGPECFRIDNPKQYPYQLFAHYYQMGPMGYGMGRLQVVRYDGKKGFGVQSRPFVIMQDRSYVDMGTVTAKTAPILH